MKILTAILMVFAAAGAVYPEMTPAQVWQAFESREGDILETNGMIYVRTEDNFDRSVSLAEAERSLKQEAVDRILEYKGGVATTMLSGMEIFEATLENQFMTRARSQRSSGYLTGIAVVTNVVTWEGGMRVRQIAGARYQPVAGDRDPDFQLAAKINYRIFRDGDRMTVTVGSERPGYVTLLCFGENGECAPLFPNPFDTNNYKPAGGTMRIPTPRMEQSTVYLGMYLPDNASQTLEFVTVIITKEPFPVSGIDNYDDMIARIAALRRDEVEFVNLGYKIIGR